MGKGYCTVRGPARGSMGGNAETVVRGGGVMLGGDRAVLCLFVLVLPLLWLLFLLLLARALVLVRCGGVLRPVLELAVCVWVLMVRSEAGTCNLLLS